MGECITRLYKCASLKRKIFSSLEIIFNFFNVAQNFEHKTLYSRTTLFPILLFLEATRLYNLQLSARSKGRRMIVEESKKREKGAYLAYTLLRETRTRTARTKSGSKNARTVCYRLFPGENPGRDPCDPTLRLEEPRLPPPAPPRNFTEDSGRANSEIGRNRPSEIITRRIPLKGRDLFETRMDCRGGEEGT